VYDDRVARAEGAGDQDERLGGAGGEEDLVGIAVVARGDCGGRGVGAGVGGEVGEAGGDLVEEPRRRRTGADVDGKIHQAVADFEISVMVQVESVRSHA
jgi:hypothetical protein